MTLSDYYPVIITVALIIGGIAALRIFFTLWAPVERLINGDRFAVSKKLQIADLKDKRVDIHLKSKSVVGGVVIVGFCSTSSPAPYPIRNLLAARHADGRVAYIRFDEIEYIEEQTGAAGRGVS